MKQAFNDFEKYEKETSRDNEATLQDEAVSYI
jgi:hypothetical protein